mgnify:CR=1 FL=1|jgi:hypothetical protein
MKTLIKIVLFGAVLLWILGWAFDNTIKYVQASELDFQFGNPAFSGNGYGTHVLSVDQLQHQRKNDVEDDAKSAASAAKRELNNTTIAKFVKNVESRIYANLSKQLVDNMFGVSCDSETTTCATSGTADVEGSTLYWVKDTTTGNITLTITDESGAVTTMTVPVGDFVF